MKNRKLRVLGLAVVAMLAIGAMASSTAFAEDPGKEQGELTTDGDTVTLDGEELGEPGSGSNALTAFGGKVECPGSTYTGHKYNETNPHKLIPNGSTTFTVNASLSNCVQASGESEFPATVQMNGCDFIYNVGHTTPATNTVGTYGLTTGVYCPLEAEIEIEAFLGGSHGFRVCTQAIPAQEGLTGLHATNTPAGGGGTKDFHVSGAVQSIVIIQLGLCGAAETEEAEADLNITFKGTNPNAEPTGVWISDEL